MSTILRMHGASAGTREMAHAVQDAHAQCHAGDEEDVKQIWTGLAVRVRELRPLGGETRAMSRVTALGREGRRGSKAQG